MRILHAHKYFHSRDGASRYERGLMRLQEEAGHSVAPFAMHEERNEPTPWSEYFVSNLDTRRVAPGFGAARQALRALWCKEAEEKFERLVTVFRPDIIHAHNLYTQLSPSVLVVARRHHIPVVMTVHDYALVSANYSLWDGNKNMDFNRLGIWATARTKYIKGSFLATLILEMILKFHHAIGAYDGCIARYVTYSDFVKDVLVKAKFAPEKISVIGAFAEPFMHDTPKRAPQRSKSGERFVLFAGRLETYKGVHVLLESMKYLPKDTRIVIAGVGPDEARLKAMAGKDPRVTFLGFVPGDELWRLMGEAVAVVVPSVWAEPFGLVALETMCQGTPVIVAKSGGLQEIVGDSHGGIIVPAGDAKALARAIDRVLSDEEFAESLSKAAFERAWAIGNPQEHLAHIMRIYSECL